MAEQPNNLEMFDVLASIRRLVSEERKSAPPRIEPLPPLPPRPDAGSDSDDSGSTAQADKPVAQRHDGASAEVAPPQTRYKGLPQESRFVLTAALRVGEEGAAPDTHLAWDEDARQDAHPAAAGTADTDTDGAAKAAISPMAEIDEIDRRTASLEETIAELEAAVADIGSEFEPDGGESDDLVTEFFPEPADQATSDPQSLAADMPNRHGGFHGIMAGFETMLPPDEVLDTPVTGDALIPPLAFSRPTAVSSPPQSPFGRAWSVPERDRPDLTAADLPKAANATFAHAALPQSQKPPTTDDADHAPDPTTDAADDLAPKAQDNRAGGGAAVLADAIAADVQHVDALDAGDAGADRPNASATDSSPANAAPTFADARDEGAEDEGAEDEGALAEEGQAGDHLAGDHLAGESLAGESLAGHDAGAGDDIEATPFEPTAAGPRLGRPQIVRSQAPTPMAADDSPDLAGATHQDDASDDDEADLFNPLAADDMDMQAMRAIVAELVREELRGVLGERITRNLRALVRNEIRKALADTGSAQG